MPVECGVDQPASESVLQGTLTGTPTFSRPHRHSHVVRSGILTAPPTGSYALSADPKALLLGVVGCPK